MPETAEELAVKEKDDKTADAKAKEKEKEDDSLEEILIEGLDMEESLEIDLAEELDDEHPDKKKVEGKSTDELKSLEDELSKLKNDKADLKVALHQARKKSKEIKKEDAPLSDAQLLKILADNDNDPQVVLNVVRYQAEQSARKVSGDVISSADIKKKQTEADGILLGMYPSLADETSEMRTHVNETKVYYGLDGNPFGDYFAAGIQVMNALPGMLLAAEKRGEENASKGNADNKRKEDIKDNLLGKGKKTPSKASLTETQAETADQLHLTEPQRKTYKKLMSNKATTVSVKE